MTKRARMNSWFGNSVGLSAEFSLGRLLY